MPHQSRRSSSAKPLGDTSAKRSGSRTLTKSPAKADPVATLLKQIVQQELTPLELLRLIQALQDWVALTTGTSYEQAYEEALQSLPLAAAKQYYQQLYAQGQQPRFGHLEAKMIRGYGPYLYLRWWEGKTHKNLYIGKCQLPSES